MSAWVSRRSPHSSNAKTPPPEKKVPRRVPFPAIGLRPAAAGAGQILRGHVRAVYSCTTAPAVERHGAGGGARGYSARGRQWSQGNKLPVEGTAETRRRYSNQAVCTR